MEVGVVEDGVEAITHAERLTVLELGYILSFCHLPEFEFWFYFESSLSKSLSIDQDLVGLPALQSSKAFYAKK